MRVNLHVSAHERETANGSVCVPVGACGCGCMSVCWWAHLLSGGGPKGTARGEQLEVSPAGAAAETPPAPRASPAQRLLRVPPSRGRPRVAPRPAGEPGVQPRAAAGKPLPPGISTLDNSHRAGLALRPAKVQKAPSSSSLWPFPLCLLSQNHRPPHANF